MRVLIDNSDINFALALGISFIPFATILPASLIFIAALLLAFPQLNMFYSPSETSVSQVNL